MTNLNYRAAAASVVLTGIVWTITLFVLHGFSIWTALGAAYLTLGIVLSNLAGKPEENELLDDDWDN